MNSTLHSPLRLMLAVAAGLAGWLFMSATTFGLDAINAPLNQLVSASSSTAPVSSDEYPRLKGLVNSRTPYVAVVRFPVQPGQKYTLLNVYPAVDTDDWRVQITGYYPLSQDTRREEGASGAISAQRGSRFTETGMDARRMNLSISPKTQGTSLYVTYCCATPGERFQMQLSSPQTPDKEVEGIVAVHPYSKRQNVSWGQLLGEYWSVPLPDEPPANPGTPGGTTPGGGTPPGTTTTGTTTGGSGTKPGDPSGSEMTVQADSVRVVSGATVTVPVRLLAGRDVASMNVTVSYNGETAVAVGPPIQGDLYEPLSIVLFESNNDRPAILRFGHATTENLSGTGVLANLVFRAVGKPGTRTPLQVQVPSIHDSSGRPITIRKIDGEIIIEPEPGTTTTTPDPNGIPTVDDARSALRMSVRLIPEDLVLDVDRDGTVTANDARILLSRAVATSR